jgi:chromosome segregation ATPase
MNGERENTVRKLEDERDRFSGLLKDRVAEKENLQEQVKVVETERDRLSELLENAKEDLDAEADAKETAEADMVRRKSLTYYALLRHVLTFLPTCSGSESDRDRKLADSC